MAEDEGDDAGGAAAAAPGAFLKYSKMGEDSGAVGAGALSAATNQYIVTEKVHGANFCLIASFDSADRSSASVRFAKRTALIGSVEEGEDFYSCRSGGLLRALAPSAEAVLRRVAGDAAAAGTGGAVPVDAVHIYGELFGGSYPHPDVPAVPGLQPVQVGVWYAPALQFMAFDVAAEASGSRTFLDFAAAKATCEACGVMFAQPLCTGTLGECLDFPIEFETTIPGRLGLPPIPRGPNGERNVAEGVVVRPRREPAVQSSSKSKGEKESSRGLFKRKIEAFSEKRYQNDDWKRGKAGGGGAAPAVSEEELAKMEISALVTEQRLANVLSKTGRVDPKDREACRQLLQDLKDDVAEALEAPEAATLQAKPMLQAELDRLCRSLITQELVAGRKRSAAGA